MNDDDLPLRRLTEQRPRLHAMAYRMLGSVSEADDALQEAWVRVRRSTAEPTDNVDGWLRVAVAHVCVDLLRSRRARHEVPMGERLPDPIVTPVASTPESEAVLADSVGLAMQVVLDRLTPAERIAFVLHDSFEVPFDRIAALLDRSPAATRQLASRARRRVRIAPTPDPDLRAQRRVVDAFAAAAHSGDFEALLAVLDPDIVLRADTGTGLLQEFRGRRDTASRAVLFAQSTMDLHWILVNGGIGVLSLEHDTPTVLLAFTVTGDRIAEIDIYADRRRVGQLLAGVHSSAVITNTVARIVGGRAVR